MDIWTCISVAGVAFFVGIIVGGLLVRFSNKIENEIEYLRDKEEELKELEARIAEMQGENPDELSLLLMKEQRLAYEAEEERAKKRVAGAGVKSHDESFRENNGDV